MWMMRYLVQQLLAEPWRALRHGAGRWRMCAGALVHCVPAARSLCTNGPILALVHLAHVGKLVREAPTQEAAAPCRPSGKCKRRVLAHGVGWPIVAATTTMPVRVAMHHLPSSVLCKPALAMVSGTDGLPFTCSTPVAACTVVSPPTTLPNTT